ncbi:c-type cytochrome [Halomonas sp. ANAO-440]|uniref:c-type cytochrome n=1 Tax=Halomonas sp. ANAO-440 TaxID=2861360 RepID=UPI001CAA6D01|nr:c-type cytochrome [Halomonas sp. ANAO-440]MBZ0329308.1 c-type cytochrome [Halomonas sp. ANAO-440]
MTTPNRYHSATQVATQDRGRLLRFSIVLAGGLALALALASPGHADESHGHSSEDNHAHAAHGNEEHAVHGDDGHAHGNDDHAAHGDDGHAHGNGDHAAHGDDDHAHGDGDHAAHGDDGHAHGNDDHAAHGDDGHAHGNDDHAAHGDDGHAHGNDDHAAHGDDDHAHGNDDHAAHGDDDHAHGDGGHGWAAPQEWAERESPLEPDAETLAQGMQVYQRYCSACHGPSGEGNGLAPAAAYYDPSPTNLALHGAAHAAGEYAWLIKEGNKASAMPRFQEKLDEDDIWSVVLYIRYTLADGQSGDHQH